MGIVLIGIGTCPVHRYPPTGGILTQFGASNVRTFYRSAKRFADFLLLELIFYGNKCPAEPLAFYVYFLTTFIV